MTSDMAVAGVQALVDPLPRLLKYNNAIPINNIKCSVKSMSQHVPLLWSQEIHDSAMIQ